MMENTSESVPGVSGPGSLADAMSGEYKNVTDGGGAGSGTSTKTAATESERAQNDHDYVYVTDDHQMVPFVYIDIRPFLSEFANEECKLAAYYRKVDRSDSDNISHVVPILRNVLQKCCFESTVRALYDLSGCYVRGIGVEVDRNMAKLLRYCAGSMRRNFDSRNWWLKRLVAEIGSRPDKAPEWTIVSMALLSLWRSVSLQRDTASKPSHIRKMKNETATKYQSKDGDFAGFAQKSEAYRQQIVLPHAEARASKVLSIMMKEKGSPASQDEPYFELASQIRKTRARIQEQFRGTRAEFARFPPRILLVGSAGVGKSTLVNTVFGLGPKEQAEVRAGGTLCTKHFAEYGPFERIPVVIIDSYGIEREISEVQREELLAYIRTRNNDPSVENHVHVAWYIPGDKWEPSDTLFVQMLRGDVDVNVVVVLTKCDLRLQIDDATGLTALELTKQAITTAVPGVPIIECAKPPEGSTYWIPNKCPRGHSSKYFTANSLTGTWICGGDENGECNEQGKERTGSFGHIELVQRTIENVPEIVRKSLQAAQVVERNKKSLLLRAQLGRYPAGLKIIAEEVHPKAPNSAALEAIMSAEDRASDLIGEVDDVEGNSS